MYWGDPNVGDSWTHQALEMYFPLFIFLTGRSDVLLAPGLLADPAIDFSLDLTVGLAPPRSSVPRPGHVEAPLSPPSVGFWRFSCSTAVSADAATSMLSLILPRPIIATWRCRKSKHNVSQTGCSGTVYCLPLVGPRRFCVDQDPICQSRSPQSFDKRSGFDMVCLGGMALFNRVTAQDP